MKDVSKTISRAADLIGPHEPVDWALHIAEDVDWVFRGGGCFGTTVLGGLLSLANDEEVCREQGTR